MSVNESAVEETTLAWFAELGYATGLGEGIAPGHPGADRESFGNVLLVRRLRDAVDRLNRTMPRLCWFSRNCNPGPLESAAGETRRQREAAAVAAEVFRFGANPGAGGKRARPEGLRPLLRFLVCPGIPGCKVVWRKYRCLFSNPRVIEKRRRYLVPLFGLRARNARKNWFLARPDIAAGKRGAKRESFGEVLLVRRLRDAIDRLNRTMPRRLRPPGWAAVLGNLKRSGGIAYSAAVRNGLLPKLLSGGLRVWA